jgi:hypothetical protein
MPHHAGSIRRLYRDPLFDRTLEKLRAKGGFCAIAAAKADDFIGGILGQSNGRDQFRFTRNGEYRIRDCWKVDLGCGYRIVCIQKGERLVLLYIGTHDECFRWIERHRTSEYELDIVPEGAWSEARSQAARVPEGGRRETDADRMAEDYEQNLLERIDDAMLRKIFSGLIERGPGGA